MCGIVGYYKKNNSAISDKALLQKMNDTIYHRGPDDSGIYCSDRVGLGHRRLSIIDISMGHQPMTDNKSGNVIVFNGEIYNFQKIKDNLMTQGHTFETKSDTEVLLKLANVDVTNWIDEINGMFAFAIWNENNNKLFLCRDRLGKKPLYYIDLDDELIFASEIKALLEHPSVERKIDMELLPEFLAFRNLTNNKTLFEKIELLPPAHCLTISDSNSKPTVYKYWDDDGGICKGFERNPDVPISTEFESLFKECIKSRLISDVPIGTFNSGGVDSSLVTAIVRSMYSGDLHSFSVGFEEKSFDESPYAQIVANKTGTIHHKLIVSENEYVNSLNKTVWSLEEPLNHPHTVPLLMLSKLAKEHVSVVLTGEGSDEVFAGYPRYNISMLSRYTKYIPLILYKSLTLIASKYRLRKVVKMLEICGDETKSVIENSRNVPLSDLTSCGIYGYLGERTNILNNCKHNKRNSLEHLLRYERLTYLSSLLIRLDKVSMHSGLEARVPFLDHRLVSWSHHVPAKNKISFNYGNKILVKDLALKWLPREIVYRKKAGFDVPVNKWLRNKQGLGRYLDYISDATFHNKKYIDRISVDKMITEHLKGDVDHGELLWGLINFELWSRMFIDNKL